MEIIFNLVLEASFDTDEEYDIMPLVILQFILKKYFTANESNSRT